jgi:hypothetical protein
LHTFPDSLADAASDACPDDRIADAVSHHLVSDSLADESAVRIWHGH